MIRRVRPLGLLLVLAAAAALVPVSALAATAPDTARSGVVAAAPCALQAKTDLTVIGAIVPTTIDVLANDCPGVASASRPLTITSVTQGQSGSVTTDGATITYDPRTCALGDAHATDFFTYTITDGATTATGTSAVTFQRPASAPLTDAPQAGFIANGTIGSTVPLNVTWCGVTASGSTVKSYRLEQSTNAGASFPTVVSAATTARSSVRNAVPGTSYAWRVRTTDSGNRVGGFAASLTSRVSLIQDTSTAIKYSSGWSSAVGKSYSGGRERYTSKAGATATLTVTNMRSVAIVASKGAGRGSFNVYVDGVRVTSTAISQKATSAAWRRVLYVRGLTSGAGVNHTVQVRAVGNGRVDLDAILLLSGKRDQTITFGNPTPSGQYNGPAYAVSATASSGLPVSLSINQASWGVCSLSGGSVTFLSAGSCRINASQSGDPTWNARVTPQTFAVAPIPLTVTGITASDRPYDGTTSATLDTSLASLDTGPVVGTDVVALDTTGATGHFASDAAGANKTVQVAGLALTGADAANYTITQPTTQASIGQLGLTVSFVTPPKPYDGTTAASISSCSLATPIGGDNVTCDKTAATATFDTANAGSGKTVTGTGFALAGSDAGNYVIDTVNTSSANVTKASQSISFTTTPTDPSALTVTYDPAATATSGLGVTFSIAPAAAAVCHLTAGTVSMDSPGTCIVAADQAGNGNYNAAAQKTQSFTVAPASPGPQTISFDLSGVAPTYGAGPVALTASATSGLTVTFASQTPLVCTVSGTDATIVAAGLCTVRASQGGNAFWDAAPDVDQSFTVAKRAITVAAVSDTKPADGTTTSAGIPTVTFGSLATGDTGTWTQTFDTALVGTNKTLTPDGTVAHGVTDVTASYLITFVPVSTGTITAGAADLTKSTVVAAPHHVKNDGVDTLTVTVQLIDAFNNLLTTSGGTVTIFADHGSMDSVTDNLDGTYTATYTSDTFAGQVTFTADLDGNLLTDTDSVNQN
jgi:hypothetical protein